MYFLHGWCSFLNFRSNYQNEYFMKFSHPLCAQDTFFSMFSIVYTLVIS